MKLKPCPFCGYRLPVRCHYVNDADRSDPRVRAVECTRCGAHGPFCGADGKACTTATAARRAWNERPAQ